MGPSLATEAISRVVPGATILASFLATVDRRGDELALTGEDARGRRVRLTWSDYADRVARVAGALQALGVGPGDRVVLMLRNRPEFHVADLAAVFCGATPISIYNSSSSEQIAHQVNHSGATVAVVEDEPLLARFLRVRRELPRLRHVVVVNDSELDADAAGVERWAQLVDHAPIDLDVAAGRIGPDDLVTVIYTSGTTGPPKGVMITQANVAFTCGSLQRRGGWTDLEGRRAISYLPMAHIAERLIGHYFHIVFGTQVTTCPDLGQLAGYLREVRPQLIFGVPRVWEKLHAGITAAVAADPDRRRGLEQAVAAASPIALALAWGTATPQQRATWETLQDRGLRAVREMVGLDQVEIAITSAAPIGQDLLVWFRALGVPLAEGWGLSETCAPVTYEPDRIKPGTTGTALPGCEIRLEPDGEILCRGGNVFRGYLDDPAGTAAVLDADGWFRTGDVGHIDDDGYLRIIDRKKEIIITSAGKNISPANLEAALKAIPIIGQACAVGDGRPYPAALLVLDPDVAPSWAGRRGIAFDTIADLARHPEVDAEVRRVLPEIMTPFSGSERVKRFVILPDEWLPDTDVLTPTAKLKRRGIHARYAAEIESLYAD